MKYILVIGDGMADNAIEQLDGKTPLEYAQTPALDALASAGTPGTVKTVPDGMPPGSDTAILSIFGCDPRQSYTGRAPLEAAANEIELHNGDVAYRCNMVSFEDSDEPFENKKLLSHSAGGIEGEISDTLIRGLWDTPEFKIAASSANIEIYPGNSFRHIAVQRNNHQLSTYNFQLKLSPPHDHIGETVKSLLPQGDKPAETLSELMKIASQILDKHPINIKRRIEGKLPANGIWFWAHGITVQLPDFYDKYGKTGTVVSAVPLCQGIGRLMGLRIVRVTGATGQIDTNYEGKVAAVIDALKQDDFAAIHIEAPDECTHDGDTEGKVEAIKRIDGRIIKPLTQKLRDETIDYRMLVLSDHKTLLSTRGHCGEPVPYIIYDSRRDEKTNLSYCEKDAVKGKYIEDAGQLMGMLFDDFN